jgi:hypothetical protein
LVGFAQTTDDGVSAQRAMDEAQSLLPLAHEMNHRLAFNVQDPRVARAIDFLKKALGEN